MSSCGARRTPTPEQLLRAPGKEQVMKAVAPLYLQAGLDQPRLLLRAAGGGS